MRVGMLLDKPFPPDPRVANEMRALAAAGHEVHLVCPTLDDRRPAVERWEAATVHRLRTSRGFYKKAGALVLRLPLYSRFFRRGFARVADEIGFEAVHVHDLPLLRAGLDVARARRLPLVADLHENYPAAVAGYDYARRWPGRWLVSVGQWRRYEAETVPLADRVVVVVPEATERFRGRIPDGRIAVVSNTVHVDEFEGFARDPAIAARFGERFTIGYLGGFDRHRGLDTVIEAFRALAPEDPAYHLLLVGEGATRAGLEATCREHGLADRVTFTGWQDFRLFPSYVEACRVCLIPHRRSEHTDTTIPHKLFHYMLLGRPVVATDCRPLRRIVEETEAGRIFPSGNGPALAAAIRELRDEDLRARLGANGRRAVLERYNWDRTAGTLVDLYRTLGVTRP